MVQALSRLLDVKPEYDWMPLNWYVNPDLPDNVINQQPSSVIADLMGVMEHIITEGGSGSIPKRNSVPKRRKRI